MTRRIGGFAVLGWLVLAAPLAAQTRALGAATSRDVAAGQQIFDAQCAWCHGAGGTGGTGPDLRRPTLRHAATDATLVDDRAQRHPRHRDAVVRHRPHRQHGVADRRLRAIARPDAQRGRSPATPQRGARALRVDRLRVVPRRQRPRRRARSGADQHRRAARRTVPARRDRQAGGGASARLSRRPRGADAAAPTIRGIRVNEDVFWIHIRDAQRHGARAGEVGRCRASIASSTATLMPSYASRLSAAELDDLVAYLATLRGAK